MRIRAQTAIDRATEEVFAVVPDPRNDPQWCGYVKPLEQTAADWPAVGARFREIHDLRPGKAVPLEVGIRELDALYEGRAQITQRTKAHLESSAQQLRQ